MKVTLANPRGFCAGVNMAIESLDRALDVFGAPLYVYHEIVHNQPVVNRFQEQGVVFVESVEDVPIGSTLLYSAHGVSPDIRTSAEQRQLRTIDATCPLVTKVHLEALRFAQKNYTIILIGHEGHDEVIGTMGEAPQAIRLVESVEEVEKLEVPKSERIAYLTQTTLSVDDANKIIEALKSKFPHIEGPPKDDICYATQNRQDAVRTLSPQADMVLVLGSQNSSNSQRLKEIAQSLGKPAYLIDRVEEIKPEWLQGVENLLITAGASAPEEVVQECVSFLREVHGADVEERTLREESVTFGLPKELKASLAEANI